MDLKSVTPKKVYMYWTVREPELLMMFSSTFTLIKENNPGDIFAVSLFATGAKKDDPYESIPFPFKRARPQMDVDLANIRNNHPNQHVLVFVCGPKPMVDDACKLSYKFNFSFHEETFEL